MSTPKRPGEGMLHLRITDAGGLDRRDQRACKPLDMLSVLYRDLRNI